MSRKSGCPFNIRDYSVSIKNPATQAFTRVKGLDSMSVEVAAQTDDGGTGDSLWAEAFIKSRSASGTIGGRPIAARSTGARDPGQELMHRAAFSEGGCGGDRTLRIADAVGRAIEYDCVITKETAGADEDGETVSWDWEGVGEPVEVRYVQASGVAFAQDGDPVTTIELDVGETAVVTVTFTPADASNRRFGYFVADEGVAAVEDVTDGAITLRGASDGVTSLTVRAMNNGLTAALEIVVGEGAGE